MKPHVKRLRVTGKASARRARDTVRDFMLARIVAQTTYERDATEIEMMADALAKYLAEEPEPDWRRVARLAERISRRARKLTTTQTEIEVTVHERAKQEQLAP